MGRISARPFRGLSIRVRLAVLFAIVLLPLLANRIGELRNESLDRLAAATERAGALANHAVERQGDRISDMRTLLEVFSRVPDVRAGNPEDCREFLVSAGTQPWLKGIWAIEPSGLVTCSTVPGGVGLDFGTAPYFRRALQTKRFVLDHYLLGRSGGQPAAVAALPVLDRDGNVTRVMMASLEIAWLGSLAEQVAENNGASVLLVDSRGIVLVRRPDLQNLTGHSIADHKLFQRISQATSGQGEIEGLDGVLRVYGFAQLPGTDARLAVGLVKREILGDINRRIWISLATFGAVSLVAALAAWFGAEAFLWNPISELARTAARFGAGDFSARPPVSTRRGDFGVLAAALNDMADELQAREEKLKSTAERMTALAENDASTGLPNRRVFERRLLAAWQRSGETGEPLALLLIEIDHFKALKEDCGPATNEAHLRGAGGVFGEVAAAYGGLAARCGENEFAVLLPSADLSRACDIAEQLRAKVEAMHLEHKGAGTGGVLTVSIGVAARAASRDTTAKILTEKADAALYAAKRLGPNRVVASTQIGPDAARAAADESDGGARAA